MIGRREGLPLSLMKLSKLWPALVATISFTVDQPRSTLAARLAHLPLVLTRNVEAGRTAEAVLLEPDPAGVAVWRAVLRVPPQRCFLGLTWGTGLGLWSSTCFRTHKMSGSFLSSGFSWKGVGGGRRFCSCLTHGLHVRGIRRGETGYRGVPFHLIICIHAIHIPHRRPLWGRSWWQWIQGERLTGFPRLKPEPPSCCGGTPAACRSQGSDLERGRHLVWALYQFEADDGSFSSAHRDYSLHRVCWFPGSLGDSFQWCQGRGVREGRAEGQRWDNQRLRDRKMLHLSWFCTSSSLQLTVKWARYLALLASQQTDVKYCKKKYS